jgi:hypothetical protein
MKEAITTFQKNSREEVRISWTYEGIRPTGPACKSMTCSGPGANLVVRPLKGCSQLVLSALTNIEGALNVAPGCLSEVIMRR